MTPLIGGSKLAHSVRTSISLLLFATLQLFKTTFTPFSSRRSTNSRWPSGLRVSLPVSLHHAHSTAGTRTGIREGGIAGAVQQAVHVVAVEMAVDDGVATWPGRSPRPSCSRSSGPASRRTVNPHPITINTITIATFIITIIIFTLADSFVPFISNADNNNKINNAGIFIIP